MRAERWVIRDRTYGLWHRVRSIARYLSPTQSAQLTMLDVDSVLFAEFRFTDKLPLALVEVARDVGQEKATAVLLGRRIVAECEDEQTARLVAEAPALLAALQAMLYEFGRHYLPGSSDSTDAARACVARALQARVGEDQ